MTGIRFIKGHGTQNDFILVPDADAALGERIDADWVRRVSDRHTGVGADGVIRVTSTRNIEDHAVDADAAEWFMDYRNADGSVAEMCGNGVRVMARYLWESGRASGPVLRIATRGGIRTVHADPDGECTVEMGHAQSPATMQAPFVSVGDRRWPVTPVWVPNPHAVAFVDELSAAGPLVDAPELSPADVFPESANVEFVIGQGDRHIALRVWERGVGETRSCGTGVCAAAWAAMMRDGADDNARYVVDVPGGRLAVIKRGDGSLALTGPAVLGVRGELDVAREFGM